LQGQQQFVNEFLFIQQFKNNQKSAGCMVEPLRIENILSIRLG
jgi:hypothetical protein